MTTWLAPPPSEQWHVGRWTMPAARPGEPGTIGTVLTHDELLLDVIELARRRGWRGGGTADAGMLTQVQILVESTRVGLAVVEDDQAATVLRRVADRAYAWLSARAPAGYRFELRDGLYLEPIGDLSADVVAPEAVIAAARDRDVPIPREVERRTTAHVTPSGGGWVVLDLPFVLAGPFDSPDEAAAVVASARDELVDALRQAGSSDLAETRVRWAAVPIERGAGRGDK